MSPDFRGAVTPFQRKVNKSAPLLCKMILDFIPEITIITRSNGNIEGFLMDWRWTQHILMQLKERQIQKDLVETTLGSPDKIIKGKKNRMIYQKIISGKLLRVVTEGDTLITVYLTNQIRKYYEGGD